MSRYIYLDLIKVVAIVMVIMCHLPLVDSLDMLGENIHILWNVNLSIGTLGVPLFMMATGALVLKKKFETKEDIVHFYRKNFLSIYITGVIWSILYYLINNIGQWNVVDVVKTILLINKPEVHLWYIRMVLMYYAVMPLLSFLCHKCTNIYCAIVFIVFLINFGWNGYDIIVCHNPTPTHSGLSLTCYLVYIAIGYWIANNKCDIPIYICILLIVVGLFAVVYLRYADYFRFFWYDNPFILIAGVGLFALIKQLMQESSEIIALSELSMMTFGIYLCHMLFLYPVGRYLLMLSPNEFVVYLGVLIITLVLAVILVRSCHLVRGLSKILFRY